MLEVTPETGRRRARADGPGQRRLLPDHRRTSRLPADSARSLRGYQPTGVCTAAHPLICGPGTITSVVVPPEVDLRPDLLFCRMAAEPGDVLKRPPDGNAIVGFIGAKGPTRAGTR